MRSILLRMCNKNQNISIPGGVGAVFRRALVAVFAMVVGGASYCAWLVCMSGYLSVQQC